MPSPSEDQITQAEFIPEGLAQGVLRLVEKLQQTNREVEVEQNNILELKTLWDLLYKRAESLTVADLKELRTLEREMNAVGKLLENVYASYEANRAALALMSLQINELISQNEVVNAPGGQA